jgi:hypothetical protein
LQEAASCADNVQILPGDDFPSDGLDDGRFPATLAGLTRLRLTAKELKSLSRQGFVCSESRGGRIYYKLRFRCAGRQKVRYIGAHAQTARQIQEELETLQRQRRLALELSRLTRLANRTRREAKARLQPLLRAAGYTFHGHEIRRTRKSVASTVEDPGE